MRRLLVSIVLAQLAAIESAAQQFRFTDVTKDSGPKITANTGVGGTNPHTVGVADFDGDGLHDIIILTFGNPHVYYYRNLGNLKFRDVTRDSGVGIVRG